MNKIIETCKKEAKYRKKAKMSNLTLMQHQHEIATELGYKNWKDLLDKNK